MAFNFLKKSTETAKSIQTGAQPLSEDLFDNLPDVDLDRNVVIKADYEWSDQEFFDRFVTSVLERNIRPPGEEEYLNTQLTALNMIYSGTIPGETQHADVLFYNFLTWSDYLGNPIFVDYFSTNEDAAFIDFPPAVPITTEIYWSTKMPKKTQKAFSGTSNDKITVAEAKEWYTYMWKTLSSKDVVNKTRKTAEMVLMLYTLKMMQLVNKDYLDVEKNIFDSMTKLSHNLYGFDVQLRIPPPHYLNQIIKTALDSKNTKIRDILTILITAIMMNNDPKSVINQTLTAGCMLSFEKTGLGPLKWLPEACQQIGMSISSLLSHLSIPMLQKEIGVVVSFVQSVGDCKTWAYARLLEPGVMTELGTRSTGKLSLILAYIARAEEEWDELSNAKSLKSVSGMREACKTLARAIKTMVGGMTVGEGITADSNKLLKISKSLLKTEKLRERKTLREIKAATRESDTSESDSDEEEEQSTKKKKKKTAATKKPEQKTPEGDVVNLDASDHEDGTEEEES